MKVFPMHNQTKIRDAWKTKRRRSKAQTTTNVNIFSTHTKHTAKLEKNNHLFKNLKNKAKAKSLA